MRGALIIIAAGLMVAPAWAEPPGLDQLPGQHFEIRRGRPAGAAG